MVDFKFCGALSLCDNLFSHDIERQGIFGFENGK